jgi:hypothetical protein
MGRGERGGGAGETPQAMLAFSVKNLQQKKPEQHFGQRFDEIVTPLERPRLGNYLLKFVFGGTPEKHALQRTFWAPTHYYLYDRGK